jgi:hypothetical protein
LAQLEARKIREEGFDAIDTPPGTNLYQSRWNNFLIPPGAFVLENRHPSDVWSPLCSGCLSGLFPDPLA